MILLHTGFLVDLKRDVEAITETVRTKFFILLFAGMLLVQTSI